MRELFSPPDWFTPQNARQEMAVAHQLRSMEELDHHQEQQFEEARASALPKAEEFVRQYESRSRNQYNGSAFPWTSESWNRVRGGRQRPLRKLISYFFHSFRHA